jgi:transglutaminase-like putative cysteine protease
MPASRHHGQGTAQRYGDCHLHPTDRPANLSRGEAASVHATAERDAPVPRPWFPRVRSIPARSELQVFHPDGPGASGPAHELTSGQATEYGKVDALANWLSAPPFRYSLSAAPFGTADGLLSFLTGPKTCYYVQYAWAMTVLTRLLGIPARFVTGYTDDAARAYAAWADPLGMINGAGPAGRRRDLGDLTHGG